MRCSKFDLIQIRTNWEVAHSVLLQSLWSLRFLKAGKMWLEHLRIQDIFSSLIPLIDEFYHLCTEWRGERSTVEEAELCFCLDTITRFYLDTENRVSCVCVGGLPGYWEQGQLCVWGGLPVYDSLLGIQSFVHGILTFIWLLCVSQSQIFSKPHEIRKNQGQLYHTRSLSSL